MIHLEVKTKLPPQETILRLKKFFGKEGLGLDITEETSQGLSFGGGGGYVTATSPRPPLRKEGEGKSFRLRGTCLRVSKK